MLEYLKCGTKSLHNAAMVVAIIDVVCTSILLILFVLGSSLMLAFEIIGKSHNASQVLEIVTDDVFGQVEPPYAYSNVRAKKDEAEDMGVWLIIMFLTLVDFIISCIFLDGVKSKNASKCQVWLNIRMVIIVVFKIVVLINLVYGTTWVQAIPDMIFTIYRLLGLYIGYCYLKELRRADVSSGPTNTNTGNSRRTSSLSTIGTSESRMGSSTDIPTINTAPPIICLSPPPLPSPAGNRRYRIEKVELEI